MTEPIDIDELRRKLHEAIEHEVPFPFASRDWAERHGPQLLDALAALRIAAEPFIEKCEGPDGRCCRLNDACRLVKLPEGAKK